jgi:ATP-dependent Clp protease ATP-binding subunit ClpC
MGLLREDESLAARVLASLKITAEDVRAHITRIVGEGEKAPTGQIPFTPRAKKALELGLREALLLGHNYVGTEHLLLGLVRENEGVASQILLESDIDATQVRNEVIRMLSGPGRHQSRPVTPVDENAKLASRARGLLEMVKIATEAAAENAERANALLRVQRSLERVSDELRHLPTS